MQKKYISILHSLLEHTCTYELLLIWLWVNIFYSGVFENIIWRVQFFFLLFSLTIINAAKFCRFSELSVLKTFLNKSYGVLYVLGRNVSLASACRGALGNEMNFVFHLVLTKCTETFLCWYWCWDWNVYLSLFQDRVCLYGF